MIFTHIYHSHRTLHFENKCCHNSNCVLMMASFGLCVAKPIYCIIYTIHTDLFLRIYGDWEVQGSVWQEYFLIMSLCSSEKNHFSQTFPFKSSDPLTRIPFHTHLPRTPPTNTIPSWVGISTYDSRKDTNIESIIWEYIPIIFLPCPHITLLPQVCCITSS